MMKKKDSARTDRKKTGGARKTSAPADKPQDVRQFVARQRKRLRHLQTALQVAVRIANAFGNQTVYRK